MVEYLRLIGKDLFTGNWHSPETLVVVVIIAGLIVIGYLIARK
jgi:hypothetical protein